MLTEIYCEAFGKTKSIPFAPGLNVIQGYSGNSIGKSSFLKIVDYAFGGRYYAESNGDIIKHVGEHDICFCHTFDGVPHYFRRGATSRKKVLCCVDSKYTPHKEISVEEFCEWLSENYELETTKATFREIVSLYVRVWNKPNKEVNRPLFNYNNQTVGDSIISLIKVFDQYGAIGELHEHSTYLEKRKKVLKQAVEYNYLKLPSKQEVSAIKKELDEIESQICHLQRNIEVGSVENWPTLSIQYDSLLDQRRILLSQQSRTRRDVKRCESNIQQLCSTVTTSFTQLVEFFPGINIKRLEEVEGFHKSLQEVLLSELNTEKSRLEKRLEEIERALVQNDSEIQSFTSLPTNATAAMVELQKLIRRQGQLHSRIALYEEALSDVDDKKATKKELVEKLEEITPRIAALINGKVGEYSELITTGNAKAPVFHLSPSQYEYGVEDNTGTGKAYTDLILFDLAILSLTKLPVLIHDSFLFNNIDDLTKQSFLRIYSQFCDKQIFISLDTFLGNDNEEIDKMLYSTTRLVLSEKATLFGKDWRI